MFAPGADVYAGLRIYLLIRLFGAPAALGNFVILGWLLGLQDSRGPLLLLIFTNAVNALLAVTLVLGLGLGVAGVAFATLTAECLGLVFGLALAAWRGRTLALKFPPRSAVVQRERFFRLLTVNRDIFLRSAMLEAAFLAFTALGSRQGEVVLAANAVLMNFFTVAAYGLDGFAHAAEAMVGKAVGARKVGAFMAAVRAGFGLASALAVALTILFWLGGPALIALLTDIASVRATATQFLPFAAVLPAVSVWAFLFDGIFFGATRAAELRNAMVGALPRLLPPQPRCCRRCSAMRGLWSAFLIFLLARALFLGLVYWRADAGAAFARGAT